MICIQHLGKFYAAALMTDGAIYTYACPGYHAELHPGKPPGHTGREEEARRWLGDHGLRKAKANKLLAAAIRNQGELATPEHPMRVVNPEFLRLAALGMEQCYSRSGKPKISQTVAGFSIDDVRDIDLRLTTPEKDQDGQLGTILARFKLRNYRGPICSISLAIFPIDEKKQTNALYLYINMAVIDVSTGKGTIITLTESREYEFLMGQRGSVHQFGIWLRDTIKLAQAHELDECLLLDGTYLTNPHPEQRKHVIPASTI